VSAGKRKGPPFRNVKLVIEYDGTSYYGWQVQAGHATVQGELGKAVEKVTGRATTILGAGRTDAGVHALGQVANFKTSCRIPARKLAHALNAHLPHDISVVGCEDVPDDFHSQFHAHAKTYRYSILNREYPSATRRLRTHLLRLPLDLDALRAGAAHLVGTHDFRAFGSEMSKKEKTVRTITAVDVRREDDVVEIDFTGEGFLYNQVRAMVGTLIEVGLGKKPASWVKEVLESKDRTQAGANVPAKGLCLLCVTY
jgi:tRNA pseudouridine38-40 synthase